VHRTDHLKIFLGSLNFVFSGASLKNRSTSLNFTQNQSVLLAKLAQTSEIAVENKKEN
jgi:hypothetical protein